MVRRPLTKRQQEVLIYLALHRSRKDIARSLGIAPNTVKVHELTLYRKLGIHSRKQIQL